MIIKITSAVFFTETIQSETEKWNGTLIDYNKIEEFREECIQEIYELIKGEIQLNLTYIHIAYDSTGKD